MSPISQPSLRGPGIEEHVERRDLAVANDDHIHPRVVGRFAARAGTPSQTTGIVEGLRFAVRRIDEVRVGRAEIASKFIDGFAPDERSGRRRSGDDCLRNHRRPEC